MNTFHCTPHNRRVCVDCAKEAHETIEILRVRNQYLEEFVDQVAIDNMMHLKLRLEAAEAVVLETRRFLDEMGYSVKREGLYDAIQEYDEIVRDMPCV